MDQERFDSWQAIQTLRQSRLEANFPGEEFSLTKNGQVLCKLCHVLLMNFHQTLAHSAQSQHQELLDEFANRKHFKNDQEETDEGSESDQSRKNEFFIAESSPLNLPGAVDEDSIQKSFAQSPEDEWPISFEGISPETPLEMEKIPIFDEQQMEMDLQELKNEIESTHPVEEELPSFLKDGVTSKLKAINDYASKNTKNSPLQNTTVSSSSSIELEDEWHFV